jgi:hypothetical protein
MVLDVLSQSSRMRLDCWQLKCVYLLQPIRLRQSVCYILTRILTVLLDRLMIIAHWDCYSVD